MEILVFLSCMLMHHVYGLFVDTTDTLYCSMWSLHQVVKRWLNDNSNTTTIIAWYMALLDPPQISLIILMESLLISIWIYMWQIVGNHRIQLFRLGELNGITVAGNTSLNTTITLNCHPHWNCSGC